MAFPLRVLLLLFLSIPFSESKSNLSFDYYKRSCPNFEKIVRETITTKQMSNPATAAGTLRLFFHDCMVEGCDASVFIASNSFNTAERDADVNLSLSGDGYEVVVRAKTTLELTCPKVVSCADILAVATRDLVTMVGGPYYKIRLGRKDGLVSKASRVEGNLPRSNMSMTHVINLFASKGFNVQEMVALTGGHTIGFSHCIEFSDRLYSYSKKHATDPELNSKFAAGLRNICANHTTDKTMSAFNDVFTPGKFDNMYFKNLPRGLGLLAYDHALVKDPRTKPFVELYATNQTVFFQDFSRAMQKLSIHGIKTAKNGEVRNSSISWRDIDAEEINQRFTEIIILL
ncbi:peroxidase 65-like [Populus alba x Populus x berolinensis]|nr:peroxidase 65-like [Populus alba x Populus x berolinensis]